MEIRDIEYFAAIAEHGHLGRAAEALALSQPALSKSLRRMEKAMQAKLVTRTAKGVQLTAEGSALLSRVRPLRVSLLDMKREIAELREGRAGLLRLGTIPGPADSLLPLALGRLLSEAPGIEVSVTMGGDLELTSALSNGHVDFCVMNIATQPKDGIMAEPLYVDEFVVYASTNHPLAKQARVTIADTAKERWAFPALDGTACRQMQRAVEINGLGPLRVTLLGGPMQIRLHAVSASRLLGVAPKRIVRQLAQRLRLVEIPVKELTWHSKVGAAYRKGAYLAPVARRFIEILKATTKDIAQEKR